MPCNNSASVMDLVSAGPETGFLEETGFLASMDLGAPSVQVQRFSEASRNDVSNSRPAQRMFQRQPGAVLLRAGDALGDEVHSIDTVGDIGIEAIRSIE